MLAREGPSDWHMSIVFTVRVGALSFLSIMWMLRVAVPVIGGLPGDQKHMLYIFSNVIHKNVIDNRMCTKKTKLQVIPLSTAYIVTL